LKSRSGVERAMGSGCARRWLQRAKPQSSTAQRIAPSEQRGVPAGLIDGRPGRILRSGGFAGWEGSFCRASRMASAVYSWSECVHPCRTEPGVVRNRDKTSCLSRRAAKCRRCWATACKRARDRVVTRWGRSRGLNPPAWEHMDGERSSIFGVREQGFGVAFPFADWAAVQTCW
jgi:hypothetical protein